MRFFVWALVMISFATLGQGSDKDKLEKELVATLENKKDTVNKVMSSVICNISQHAMPSDGFSKFYEWVNQNMVYPQSVKSGKIKGKVFLSFIIERNGKISDIKVKRSLNKECDKEAIRVLSLSSNWIPAKGIGGRETQETFVLPFTFDATK